MDGETTQPSTGVPVVQLSTGQLGTVPHEQLEEAIRSGEYGLPQGTQIPVTDPFGEPGTIPAEHAAQAFAKDYSYLTPAKLESLQKQEKYSGPKEGVKAFAEGAIDSVPFVGGPILRGLHAVGLGGSPEDVRARAEVNPVAHGAGELAGLGAQFLVPGAELVSPAKAISGAGHAVESAVASRLGSEGAKSAASKIVQKAAQKGAGSLVEGLAFGAGQVANEAALGDPDLTAESATAQIGLSGVLAGGFGAALGATGETAGLLKSKLFPSELKKTALAEAIASKTADTAANAEAPVVPPTAPGIAPSSLEELEARVKGANLPEGTSELPSKQALLEASHELSDLQYPAHAVQVESLNDPRARDVYKTFLEGGSDEAKTMRAYESLQKREGVEKLHSTIDSIAPTHTPTADPVRAGNDLIDAFKAQYETEKKELAPLFKQFDDAAVNPIVEPEKMVRLLEDAVPGAENYIGVKDDKFRLAPYRSTMPFSRTAYESMKDVVEAANDPELTIGGLRNLRESMRDKVNFLSAPREASQISSMRKSLMDYIETEIAKSNPELEVRDAFRRYAVNEEKRATIERIVGGSIHPAADFSKAIRPEDVVDRLFGNTVAISASKDVLGDQFNKALASYLKIQADRVTDSAKNGFSSAKFASFLKRKEPELAAALAEKPQMLNRLQALADFMRILPDSPSVNPSGTAKTLNILQSAQKVASILDPVGYLRNGVANVFENLSKKAEAAKNRETMQLMLKGRAAAEAEKEAESRMARYSVLKRMEELSQKTSKKIESAVRDVFHSTEALAPAVAGKLTAPSKESRQERLNEFTDRSEELMAHATNPEGLLDKLESGSSHVYPHAPSITGNVHRTAATAVSFLSSKVPTPSVQRPLSAKWEPSQAEISKFNRYYDAVEDPVSVIRQVASGTLSIESLDALKTVYPSLYNHMQSELLSALTSRKGRLSYRTRLGLSMFLGQDLDGSTDSRAVLANQLTINGPSRQNDAQSLKHPPIGGLSKLNTSSLFMTPLQQTATRN